MKQKFIIFLVMGVIAFAKAGAQQVEKGFEMMEVLKIADTYKQAGSLSFDMYYTYTDSAHLGSVLESMNGSTKISNGRYWTKMDSAVESLQGYQYNITLYYQDSTIVLGDRQDMNKVLSMPMLDTMFQQSDVDSLKITEYDDSTRKLTVFFGSYSAYRQYTMLYDKNSYLIRSINYNIRNTAEGATATTGLITLTLSDYSFGPVDESVFREDKYVYKQNGQYFTKPGYTNFQLQVNTIN